MNKFIYILLIFIASKNTFSQTAPYKENSKWGLKKNNEIFIPALYDTILPFDSVKQVCMACIKSMKPSNSKIIKMNTMTFVCKYFNSKKEQLVIKIKNDTCGYFNLNRNSFNNYSRYRNHIVVCAKDKKYAVDNNFRQITFMGYDEIMPSSIKDRFVVQNKTVGASYLEGVIDENEKMIIPMEYTSIKANPFDTLFIGCTAQIKLMGKDDIFDIYGKKIQSFNRHIEYASKNFIVHKIFEPKEYYIVYEIANKKEKTIYADDITYLGNDIVNIKIKDKYFKSSLYKLDELKILNNEQN